MKVVLICNSDTTGGAAVVTHRLMNALTREGVDARMLVYSKQSQDSRIDAVGSRTARSMMFTKERLGIFMKNGFSREDLFKVSTADSGIDLADNPWVREADIILLSWVNQGLLSLRGIEKLGRLGKPIVWMMHDMWNLTGICHHAYECTRYTGECGCCPYLHSSNPRDLSHRIWCRKNRLYDTVPISFVAVSNWLAEKCRESSLMRDRDITVIPNPFPVDLFATSIRKNLNVSAVDYSKKIIIMGAARLDDPIKGLDYAIDALNEIFTDHPRLSQDTMALFFGNVRDSSKFDRLNFPFQLFGIVNDPKVLRELYAASKVVLSTSLYETLPGTLIEGQAAGAIPVTFGRGGQSDIVDHLETGYIARYKDSHSIAEGILWALNADIDRDMLHGRVVERFSSQSIARRYIELFDSLLAKKPTK